MSKTMIDNRIYNDSWFFNLSPESKFLFIFLVTNPSCSLTGCYEMPLPVLSAYTNIPAERIEKIFAEFKGKAVYEKGWVIIPNYQKHNPMRNPNIEKSMSKQLETMPDWILKKIETLTKGLPNPSTKGLVTLQGIGIGNGIGNETETEQETEEGYLRLKKVVENLRPIPALN